MRNGKRNIFLYMRKLSSSLQRIYFLFLLISLAVSKGLVVVLS